LEKEEDVDEAKGDGEGPGGLVNEKAGLLGVSSLEEGRLVGKGEGAMFVPAAGASVFLVDSRPPVSANGFGAGAKGDGVTGAPELAGSKVAKGFEGGIADVGVGFISLSGKANGDVFG
jgi:hypothetical protein